MTQRGRPQGTPLPYVPIKPNIKRHLKTIALIDALEEHTKIPTRYLWTIPVNLILHCGEQEIDGDLRTTSPKIIARICEWDGDPELLVRALIDSTWLDRDAETGELKIHNWDKYGGQVLSKREQWAAEKREQRKQQRVAKKKKTNNTPRNCPSDNPRTSAGRPTDVRETSNRRPTDVRNCPSVKCEVKDPEMAETQMRKKTSPHTQTPPEARKRAGLCVADGDFKKIIDRLADRWLSHFELGTRTVTRDELRWLRARLRDGRDEQDICRVLDYVATTPWYVEHGETQLKNAVKTNQKMGEILLKLNSRNTKAAAKLSPTQEAFLGACQILEQQGKT